MTRTPLALFVAGTAIACLQLSGAQSAALEQGKGELAYSEWEKLRHTIVYPFPYLRDRQSVVELDRQSYGTRAVVEALRDESNDGYRRIFRSECWKPGSIVWKCDKPQDFIQIDGQRPEGIIVDEGIPSREVIRIVKFVDEYPSGQWKAGPRGNTLGGFVYEVREIKGVYQVFWRISICSTRLLVSPTGEGGFSLVGEALRCA
jgi:hypothetical protein